MVRKLKLEQRFSVKSENRRSTIWKISIYRSDVYVMSRLTHQVMKLSLHESGDCNYSFTSEYVKKTDSLKRENRHIKQWKVNPTGANSEILFELFIPDSELVFHNIEKKLSKVHWIDSPGAGKQVQLVGYLTPKVIMGQSFNVPEELGNVLMFEQLENLKYFILVYNIKDVTYSDMARMKEFKSGIMKTLNNNEEGWHGLMATDKGRSNAFVEFHILERV